MKYINNRKINGDYFTVQKRLKGKYNLDYYINQINKDNYYIVKLTNSFRFVSWEDFCEFKYSGYTFFRKDLYSKDDIQLWLNFIKVNKINLLYLNKPFPNNKIINKLKIIENI